MNPVGIGETLSFSADGAAERFLGDGWSGGESWGRWADGNEAELLLDIIDGSQEDLFMTLKAGGFVADKHPETMTEVMVNNCIVGRLRFTTANASSRDHFIRVPRPCISEGGEARIVFRNLSPVSPKQVWASDDVRRLGIGLVSIRFDRFLKSDSEIN